jgi:hypothetical protein
MISGSHQQWSSVSSPYPEAVALSSAADESCYSDRLTRVLFPQFRQIEEHKYMTHAYLKHKYRFAPPSYRLELNSPSIAPFIPLAFLTT